MSNIIYLDTFKRENIDYDDCNSLYEYYSRSDDPDIINIYENLDNFIGHYKESGREEIIARIKKDDIHSAFFELFLYQNIIDLGYEVLIHPPLVNSNKKPDFLCWNKNEKFYLEAVVPREFNKDTQKKQKIMKQLRSYLKNHLPKSLYLINYTIQSYPNSTPEFSVITKYLEKTLKNECINEEYIYAKDGWDINFSFIKRKNEGKTTFGFYDNPFTSISNKSIRNAIIKKCKRYGHFCKPYLIAINIIDPLLTVRDNFHNSVLDLLLGDRQQIYSLSSHKTDCNRRSNGVWWNRNKIRYRNNSGVIVFNKLKLFNDKNIESITVLNPWTENEYNGDLCKYLHYKKYKNIMKLFGYGDVFRTNNE